MPRGISLAAAGAVALAVAVTGVVYSARVSQGRSLVVGVTSSSSTTPLSAPSTTGPPPVVAEARDGLIGADGHAYGRGRAFRSTVPISPDLVFVLAVGSDARPGFDVQRSNADSIHLLAVNPRTQQATVVGFPRDSWVEIPGHGTGKLNSAMQIGGPRLLADTVHRITGLPVHYYAVVGFQGFPRIVDDLGGIDVHVDRRMNDAASGARFEAGWHHFTGAQALAFARNRHDVPNGDFSRSENQGKVIVAALAKMWSEVDDDSGVARWIDVLVRHATIEASPSQLLALGSLARRVHVSNVANVIVPGRVGTAGKASVVYLTAGADDLFIDLRDDAVLGSASSSASPSQETTTTSPDGVTIPTG